MMNVPLEMPGSKAEDVCESTEYESSILKTLVGWFRLLRQTSDLNWLAVESLFKGIHGRSVCETDKTGAALAKEEDSKSAIPTFPLSSLTV